MHILSKNNSLENSLYKASDPFFYQNILFIINYLIIIPILLFLISRLLRCLRRRGIVSANSEECMMQDYNRRLMNVLTQRNNNVNTVETNKNDNGCSSNINKTESSIKIFKI